MDTTIYVIGHRNPDTDSIASAVAYAGLKRRLGNPGAVAAMAGAPNRQTRFVLDRLALPDPVLLADVHPRVRDTINRKPVTVGMEASAAEALELFHENGVRTLPVVDGDGRPWGVLSLLRLSETYLLPRREKQREILTTLPSLARTLSGRVATGTGDGSPLSLRLFIGAMQEESFSSRIAGHDPRELLVLTGNRPSIQRAAVERGVRILVVTGDHPVEPALAAEAQSRGVTVLLTPHDTAAAAWLARVSTPVRLFADRKYATIDVGEPLENLRRKLLGTGESSVLALEGDGTLAGVATKSSLLAPLPYALVLVDHNELSQAVPGAEAVEVLEVIDHHKLGNGPTIHPISFLTSPVGSTCTLVEGRWRESGLDPDPATAALLLAGILSDTVLLRSPTTTEADVEAVKRLERLSGRNAEAWGREIFAATSSLKAHGPPAKIVESDFKIFAHGEKQVGVGQVEVTGFDEFLAMKGDLLEALARLRKRDGLYLAGLMVTDIATETTLFLVEGYTRISHSRDYPLVEPHLYEMKGVLSRKKQLVPYLLKVLARTGD